MASAGCKDRLCEPEVNSGGHYRADILDRYDAQSRFAFEANNGLHISQIDSRLSCAGLDGIQPGGAVELQGVGESTDHARACSLVAANLVHAPEPTIIVAPAATSVGHGAPVFMYAVEDVSIGSCAGVLDIEMLGSGDVFAVPVEGQFPKAVLYRAFFPAPSAPVSCGSCEDNFVVQFTKL